MNARSATDLYSTMPRLLATRSNPFATRWVRPGAIPYLFPPGESLPVLVERLEASAWRGEIIGPHGSGKSTLVAHLAPALATCGRNVSWYPVGSGRSGRPTAGAWPPQWSAATQVVVDGYEQLGRLARLRLQAAAWRAGCGLLITTHRPAGFPQLMQTGPVRATVLAIVDELLAGDQTVIGPVDVAASMSIQGANVREILFDLYDLYERRTRGIRNV